MKSKERGVAVRCVERREKETKKREGRRRRRRRYEEMKTRRQGRRELRRWVIEGGNLPERSLENHGELILSSASCPLLLREIRKRKGGQRIGPRIRTESSF